MKCSECDHNPLDCLSCPEMIPLDPYQQAWERLRYEVEGKFNNVTVGKIHEIMDEIIKKAFDIRVG